jgi:galactose mutarotase-like enzyme
MRNLENELVQIQIADKGAEITSFVHKQSRKEIMWQADPKYWARTSPILFPIVGKLKDNSYTYDGVRYELPQHGFARDKEFEFVGEQAEKNTITHVFRLDSDENTLAKYPFKFTLYVSYKLEGACLTVTYTVQNPGETKLWFSIGAHPGFACKPSVNLSDVKAVIRLDMGRELLIHRLQNGLVNSEATEGLLSTLEGRIELTDELIEYDAMVFKRAPGRWVDLQIPGETAYVRVIAKDWPYYGIWSKPSAPFVCLEPWYGVADSVDTTQNLEEKEGIINLEPGKTWEDCWSIEVK